MEAITVSSKSGSRPEGMADVPGICELSLTRAVVQYRESDGRGISTEGSVQDIGLGLVVDGRFAGASKVLDLGSGKLKVLDLSSELVILDWVHQPTLDHVNRLIEKEEEGLVSYSFSLAMKLLGRVGYGPLTRSILLRIGFRDIRQDLDSHEGTAIRIVWNQGGSVARVHLDFSRGSLVFTVPGTDRCKSKEKILMEAFPGNEIVYMEKHIAGLIQYEVPFKVPSGWTSLRLECSTIRASLMHLLKEFEPDRYEVLRQHLAIFGMRDTLSRIPLDEQVFQETSPVTTEGKKVRLVNTVH